MKFDLLASGSAGNCCVIQDHHCKIVIDCGTNKKYLLEKFNSIDFDIATSDALFITHTHSDHISQIKLFDQIPTFSNQEIQTNQLTRIQPYESVSIQHLKITALPMSHDCEGTLGFIVQNQDEKLVYITDTGYIKEEIFGWIENADYYIFESNHDIEMLMQTNRPIYLKQRIINVCGHLCNEDCARILGSVIGGKTVEIVLAHISREGNTRELALKALIAQFEKLGIAYDQITMHAAEQFALYQGGKR